jgi:ATPase
VKIESLEIRNYRVLKDVVLKDLGPLTVLCGANGSGKSTLMDVFAFLHEAFTDGLRRAWDKRNRMAAICSRGQTGPVSLKLKYRAEKDGKQRLVTYFLAIEEEQHRPVVVEEKLQWSSAPGPGRPRNILSFKRGHGEIYDEATETKDKQSLSSPDLLAVATLGQLQAHPRVAALRDFITGWYLSHLNVGETRVTPESGPQELLSTTGDNLANVIQYLEESHPEALEEVFEDLSHYVPQIERLAPEHMDDGRLLLLLKDKPFEKPVMARYASDGTLRLLAYLTLLHSPVPVPVIGIEEPENQLHPKVVPALAESIRRLSRKSQVFVTTHSPEFLLSLEPGELRVVSRTTSEGGFANISRPADSELIQRMLAEGMNFSELWSFGYLEAADPKPVDPA